MAAGGGVGLLERLMGSPALPAPALTAQYGSGAGGALDDFWYSVIERATAAGINVTPDSAMKQSAVLACVRVITEDVGSTALHLFRRRGSTTKERIGYNDMPLARILGLQPNRWQTSMEWREMTTGHCLLRGDGYSYIQPGPSGFVEELIPLHPDRMKPERMPGGAVRYIYQLPDGTKQTYTQDEIFHLPGLGFDGLRSLSVIGLMREAIGSAIAAEKYGGTLFSQGMSATGVLEHPGHLSPEGIENLRSSFVKKYGGAGNAGSPLILEEGMKWSQLSMTSEDAQWLETRKFELEEIARGFRMKPHKIGILEHATFSNIENESIAYVTDTIRPWVVRWEQRILMQLIARPDLFFAEFNLESLLRGDIKSRYEAYHIARLDGVINPNEWRERENMNPQAGDQGDIYWRPVNMVPADTPVAAVRLQSPSGGAASPRLRLLATEMAGRLVKKEIDRVSRAAKQHADDAEAWGGWLDNFYAEHGREVARTLHLPEALGERYAAAQLRDLRGEGGGVAVMETWMERRPAELAELAIEGGD